MFVTGKILSLALCLTDSSKHLTNNIMESALHVIYSLVEVYQKVTRSLSSLVCFLDTSQLVKNNRTGAFSLSFLLHGKCARTIFIHEL